MILTDIGICLMFFTRLPVGSFRKRPLIAAMWAAPLAGIVVACFGTLAFWLAAQLGLQPGICAALCLLATMLVTGCLHEDGLADVADGFGGGATLARKLEIMRDSHIGSYGVLALILSVLLRWSALTALITPGMVFPALLAAHGAARAVLPGFMQMVAPARADGISAGAGRPIGAVALQAAGLGGLTLLTLGIGPAVIAALALGAVFIAVRWLCESQIGGQTGDVLGLLEQVTEIAVLLVACATRG